ncbi:MAG: fumarylacetoacetase [Candidatus Dormibacteria bacterium]
MIDSLDETHAREATSFVQTANLAQTDFPIQNLPFGVFRAHGEDNCAIGVAIGDSVLDLKAGEATGCLRNLGSEITGACREDSLNKLMSLNAEFRLRLRHRLFNLLHASAESGSREAVEKCLIPLRDSQMQVPASIGDYTDFYASIFHATNVGSLFRPDNPLSPNYKWVPIGYHGRASSIVISGTAIRRPHGQAMPEKAVAPVFGASRGVDYELEIGAYVAGGNVLGKPIPIANAEAHIFGLCLVNDWSARDIQSWEYQPLGPFLSKNFATTISPWVITAEALAPYRCAAFSSPADDPQPLPYLDSEQNRRCGGIDITLEVSLSSARMREQKIPPIRLSRGRFREMYWTIAQLLAHHTSGGCNLRPGDLLASGTISGSEAESSGCLLEITRRGAHRLELPTGEKRIFLEDDDEVIFRAWCEAPHAVRIGFGECKGTLRAG